MKAVVTTLAALLGLVLVVSPGAGATEELAQAQRQLQALEMYDGAIDGQDGETLRRSLRRFQIRNGLDPTGELDAETMAALNEQSGESASAPETPPSPPQETASPEVEQDREFLRQEETRRPAPSATPTPTPTPRPRATPAPTPEAQRAVQALPAGRLPLSDLFAGTRYEFAAPQLQEFVVRDVQTRLRRMRYYRGRTDGRDHPGFREALRDYQVRRGLEVSGRIDGATLASLGMRPRY